MKIIHSSGRELKLKPGTVLDMERTNPFFNEYGEQSLPVKVPDDPYNRQTLGFPNDVSGTEKIPQRADATIQEGVFSIRCRQAILSAGSRDGIDTSYYLNIGSFYEKMKELKLPTVFKDKVIKFASVDAAVDFVRGLMVTPDPRFACFPALVEHQDTESIYTLNFVDYPLKSDGYYSFYHEVAQTEVVNDKKISVPAGYYITPFIRVVHLLQEIFKNIGYTMEDNFFTRTSPFSGMVLLNNNIDTIVNAEIRYDQLVPDCNVSTILDIFRNKFCCEFIPDEVRKTVNIVLFNEVVDGSVSIDLTNRLTSSLIINHAAKYKQIKLSCDKGQILEVSDAGEGKTKLAPASPDYFSKPLQEILLANPDAIPHGGRGWIYKDGFTGDYRVRERVGSLNCDYFAGGDLEAEKKESPDTLVSMEEESGPNGMAPFVGKSRSLNSSIVLDNEPRQGGSSTEKEKKESELKPMLCFVYHDPSKKADIGTIYAYDFGGNKYWNYALCYNGPDGLYEKFWRKYDEMLRNSMRPVTARLMLSETDKLNVTAYEKVMLTNQELLPNVWKYHIGKKTDTECTFLTTKLYSPVSSANLESVWYNKYPYRWEVKMTVNYPANVQYYRFKETPAAFYPAPPTEAQYIAGGKCYEKNYAVQFGRKLQLENTWAWEWEVDGTITVWLEPAVRPY